MYIFDSHAHYFDDRYSDPAEGPGADEILKNILAHQRQRLLLEVSRLLVEVESLRLDFGLRLLGALYAPQRLEGV